MKSATFGAVFTPSTSVTTFAHIAAVAGSTSTSARTANGIETPMPGAFTASNFRVRIPSTSGSGTFTVNVLVNGSAEFTVALTGGTLAGIDTGTLALSEWDLVCVEIVPTGSPTAVGKLWWSIEMTGTGQPIFGSNNAPGWTNYHSTSPAMGGNNVGWSYDGFRPQLQQLVPIAGTASALHVALQGGNPGGTTKTLSYTIERERSGSYSTGLTAAIVGTATTAESTGTLDLDALDTVALRLDPANAPTARGNTWSWIWEPDTAGQAICMFGHPGSSVNNGTDYNAILGNGRAVWSAGGSDAIELDHTGLYPGPMDLKTWAVRIQSNAFSNTIDHKVLKSGSDTALSVSVATTGSKVGTSTGTVTVTDTDWLAIRHDSLSVGGYPGVVNTGLAYEMESGGEDLDLAADGTITASGDATIALTAVLAAAGSVAASGDATIAATLPLTADGTVAATGSASFGASTITADGTITASGDATLTGTLSLSAAGTASASGAVAFTPISLTSDGTITSSGTATFSSPTYPITAAGSVTADGALTIVARLALTATGSITVAGDADLDTTGGYSVASSGRRPDTTHQARRPLATSTPRPVHSFSSRRRSRPTS